MKRWSSRLRFALRAVAAALFVLPILWMVAAALHPPGVALPRSLSLLPEDPSLATFGRVWDLVPLGRFGLNSLLVAAVAVPLTVVTSSWAGLAMARLPRPSQRRWVVLSLAVLMVPGAALWASRFLVYEQLGLIDTLAALVAPAVMGSSPFYVLMFYRAFRRIPASIYDAALIDGAGVWQTWGRVALPMVRPTAVGVALLSLILYWGDYTAPLLYLGDQDRYTLPVALELLSQLSRADWPLLMAGATLVTAVPVAIFLLLQPYFARIGR
ncbi:MAG: carbohydrate ABC transporter permease [Candidatus Promineifilaceae bacterium]|nr:carbohydrate ABC transporter permease [Candidatus Promineifilaceae bacterium]